MGCNSNIVKKKMLAEVNYVSSIVIGWQIVNKICVFKCLWSLLDVQDLCPQLLKKNWRFYNHDVVDQLINQHIDYLSQLIKNRVLETQIKPNQPSNI